MRDRKQLIWPASGLLVALLLSLIPSRTGIPLSTGIFLWCATTLGVLAFSGRKTGLRLAALAAGLFPLVPCFVVTTPLLRGLLACFGALPLGAAAALVQAPLMGDIRARLAYLFTWCGRQTISRRTPCFDDAALRNLVAATVIVLLAMAGTKAATVSGLWWLRWLAGGVLVLAFGEMIASGLSLSTAALGLNAPPLFRSPHRSVSINDFWTRRWNIFTARMIFRPCFLRLARRSVPLAVVATFALSGVLHALLALLLLGEWGMAASCGAFFFVQPLLIAAERRMQVRSWRPAAARAWTLCALAVTSPLIIEPALRIIEQSWGPPEYVLVPALWVLVVVMVFAMVVALGSMAAAGGGIKVTTDEHG